MSLEELVASKPVVLLLNSVDPFSHKIQELFEKFAIPSENINLTFVNSDENGPSLAQQTEALVAELREKSGGRPGQDNTDTLPHVYLGGEFFFGGQDLEKLLVGNPLRNKLIEVGALTLKKIDEVKEIVDGSKVVCFLNTFSPFCLSARDILRKYDLAKDEAIMKYVYTDQVPEGEHIEHAALYLGKCDNLPVLFVGGKSLGSFQELQDMHTKFTFEKELVHAGVYRQPAFDRLESLKEEFGLLMIGNDFSGYSLKAKDIIENLHFSAGNVSIIYENNPETEDLLRAARLSTKSKHAPYIFICGDHMDTKEFFELNEKNTLTALLKDKGILKD